MEPGSNVVLLADPWERGVGSVVIVGYDGQLLVDWACGGEQSRTWHPAHELAILEAWLPTLSPADMIELGGLPPAESA